MKTHAGMSISDFENGKTRIMGEARQALRRIGVDYHCVMFDVHGSEPRPDGATLTVTAEGRSVSRWFDAADIVDSQHRVGANVKNKVSDLVVRVMEPVC